MTQEERDYANDLHNARMRIQEDIEVGQVVGSNKALTRISDLKLLFAHLDALDGVDDDDGDVPVVDANDKCFHWHVKFFKHNRIYVCVNCKKVRGQRETEWRVAR